MLAKTYEKAIKNMNEKERIEYYWFLTDCVFGLAKGDLSHSVGTKFKSFKM